MLQNIVIVMFYVYFLETLYHNGGYIMVVYWRLIPYMCAHTHTHTHTKERLNNEKQKENLKA